AAHVPEAGEQTIGHGGVDLGGSELAERGPHIVAEFLLRHLGPGKADHREAFRQQTGGREIVERRDQQPFGEIAPRAANHEAARTGRTRPFLSDGGVARRYVHHELRVCGSTWPPKPLRIADSIRSAKLLSSRERKRA